MTVSSPARMKLVRFAVTGAFALVAARSAQLSIWPDGRLTRLADRQHSSAVDLAPKRGTIFDRRGNILAQSVEVDSIYAEPRRLKSMARPDRKKLIASLSRALEMPERTLGERLDSDRGFVWLKRRVSPETAKAVASLSIEGIGSVRESKRFYPNVELAGHVLGFSGLDSEGLEGLERGYDDILKSDAKRYERPRDARGRGYSNPSDNGIFVGEEETGQELLLTIDQQIQFMAEDALRRGVESSKAAGGFVVVQDPRTGEILAMAGSPGYNPNAFWKSTPDRWRNRAVTDVFEPGSTLKPVLIAAALDARVLKREDIFFCENGSFDVADLTIRDSKKHGWLDVPKILQVSSNIGMIKIGRLLGKDGYLDALQTFGFDAKSGIDLPGEAKGLVPPRNRWTGVTLASASFGHNVGVTGLQLTAAISAIANGGVLMKPYVVRRVLGPDGSVVRDVDPVEVRRVVRESVADQVAEMMELVITPEGTGAAAALPDYRVAGKTGTAQKVDAIAGGYSDARIASFVGFAPVSDPRLTILVVVDEPKTSVYGGVVAAPVFREIADGALRYLGVPADRRGSPSSPVAIGDDLAGEGSVGVRSTSEAGKDATKIAAARELAKKKAQTASADAAKTPEGVVPDFGGLTVRASLRVAEPRALVLEVHGSGRIVRQEPDAGAKADAGGKVRLWLEGGES